MLWILGGGTLRGIGRRPPRPANSQVQDWRLRESHDRRDCWDAYNQFRLIERSLPAECLVAYTDGSVKDRRGGSGVAVYLRGRILHEIVSTLGDYPIGD